MRHSGVRVVIAAFVGIVTAVGLVAGCSSGTPAGDAKDLPLSPALGTALQTFTRH